MAFGFNNPLLFSDPTGLSGECEGCPEFAMPVFTIRHIQQNSMLQLESYYHALRQSHNPVYRNLGMTAYREGVRAARDLSQRGRKLHYSESEALASQNSRYLDGIGKMVSYGITGSIVAAAASPMLVRGLVDGLKSKVFRNMAFESGFQVSSSLLFKGNLGGADIADIGMSGIFGKWAFIGHALIDVKSDQGFSTSFGIGQKKSIYETTVDLGIGGYNRGFNQLLDMSEINKNVIKIVSSVNGSFRTIVGETMKIDQ